MSINLHHRNCNTFICILIKKCCNSVTIEMIKFLWVALIEQFVRRFSAGLLFLYEEKLVRMDMFRPIHVFFPYTYGLFHTRMGCPYAYGPFFFAHTGIVGSPYAYGFPYAYGCPYAYAYLPDSFDFQLHVASCSCSYYRWHCVGQHKHARSLV